MRAFMGIVPRSFYGLAVARFLALTILLTFIIHENVKNVNFFCEKIAKNVKTGFILANFSFLSTFFLRENREKRQIPAKNCQKWLKVILI